MSLIIRLALPFAIGGWIAAVFCAVGAVTLRVVDPAPVIPSTFGYGNTALAGMAVLGVAFATVGALLVVRRPGNIIGWLMVIIGDGYAVGVFWSAVTFSLAAHPSAVDWLDVRVAAWLTVLFTSLGGMVLAIGFIFPTGRGHTPAWDRALKVAAIVTPIMFVQVFVIRPGPLHLFPEIDNPFGFGFDFRPLYGDHVSERLSAWAVILVPLVIWSVVSRYRLAGQVERQQLKWFGLATGITITCLAVGALSATVFDDPPEIGLALFGFVGTLVPAAIGIAITRYRLFEIDRIVSRTISYLGVSAILFAVFAFITLMIGSAIGDNPLTVAVSTLAIAALFNPLRIRMQRAVDRRFNRSRVDQEAALGAFTAGLRDEIDAERLMDHVRSAVTDAVEPTTISIWRREPGTQR
jgi:hypothetical protein